MKYTNYHSSKPTNRIDSINSLLKKEISRIIMTQVKDPRLSNWVSVTDVKTSKDLQKSTVYISIMEEKASTQKTLRALKSASKFIETILHKELSYYLSK